MRATAFLLLATCFTPIAFSQSSEQATLDMILAEVRTLNEKVANLEKRVAVFESNSEEAPEAIRAAIEYAAANPPPVEGKSPNKWYENLRVELKKADVRASGNWVKPESWERIETKMTPEEVIAILGEPTARKFSIRKDTDEILIYEGDLHGDTGKLVRGKSASTKAKSHASQIRTSSFSIAGVLRPIKVSNFQSTP